MSIERLNKAATAAGYAMATPDDELPVEVRTAARVETPVSRSVVLASNTPQEASTGESITRMAGWLKSYLPAMGWRAPA